MSPFRKQGKTILIFDARAPAVEKKIRAKLLALGGAIEPPGGSRLAAGAAPDKKRRDRTTLPGRAPAVGVDMPLVTGVEPDGTSSKGEPMVVVRLVCLPAPAMFYTAGAATPRRCSGERFVRCVTPTTPTTRSRMPVQSAPDLFYCYADFKHAALAGGFRG